MDPQKEFAARWMPALMKLTKKVAKLASNIHNHGLPSDLPYNLEQGLSLVLPHQLHFLWNVYNSLTYTSQKKDQRAAILVGGEWGRNPSANMDWKSI